jgi:hypothetical protein
VWAVTLCRRLALCQLVALAEFVEGRIPLGHAEAVARLALDDEAAARRQLDEIDAGKGPQRSKASTFAETIKARADFDSAVTAIEAAAWAERGVFEGDCAAPAPLVQNERHIAAIRAALQRGGVEFVGPPPPDGSLDFTEDRETIKAQLKRAVAVIEDQSRPSE